MNISLYRPHQILSDTSGNYIYGDKSHLQLQLCGSAIPPAPPRLKNRVGYKQSPSNARCSYYHPHSSTTQGLTINDRLRVSECKQHNITVVSDIL